MYSALLLIPQSEKVSLDILHPEGQWCQVFPRWGRCTVGCRGSRWTTKWSAHACILPAPAWTRATAGTSSNHINIHTTNNLSTMHLHSDSKNEDHIFYYHARAAQGLGHVHVQSGTVLVNRSNFGLMLFHCIFSGCCTALCSGSVGWKFKLP